MQLVVTGKITKINEYRYMLENGQYKYNNAGQPKTVVDFRVSVNRESGSKRKYNKNEYSVDFYKVSLYDKTAENFVKLAQVGKIVQISGNLLQREDNAERYAWITPDNPAYNCLLQLVGQLPQQDKLIWKDNCLYLKGVTEITRHEIQGNSFQLLSEGNHNSNPNMPQGNYQQPQYNDGAYPQQPQNNAPSLPQNNYQQYQPTANPQQMFGGNQPVAPQPQMPQSFPNVNMQQPNMPMPQGNNMNYVAPQQPVQPANFPGYGAPSGQPQNFNNQMNTGFNLNPNAVAPSFEMTPPIPNASGNEIKTNIPSAVPVSLENKTPEIAVKQENNSVSNFVPTPNGQLAF